jgi:hypothetical protein
MHHFCLKAVKMIQTCSIVISGVTLNEPLYVTPSKYCLFERFFQMSYRRGSDFEFSTLKCRGI